MLDSLTDADRLLDTSDCDIVKDQKKVKVGRVSLNWGEVKVVYIKRYNAFSLRYRLQSIIACSGAERSLRGAALLSAIGVPIARPVAVIEHRNAGMLVKSFYVSDEVKGGKTADAFWREDLKKITGVEGVRCRRRFLRKLAELFSRLHEHHVYHNDLKDANIIVAPGSDNAPGSLYLLDLEGVRRYARLSRGRHVKNLVQLNRTLGRYLRRSELLFFLHCYLSGNTDGRGGIKAWAKDILKRSERLDRIKNYAGA